MNGCHDVQIQYLEMILNDNYLMECFVT